MKILLASSEVHPFSKTGGLADMVGALGKTLARAGHEVRLLTPLYRGIRGRFPQMKRSSWRVEVALGTQRERATLDTLELEDGLSVDFLDHPGFFDRPGLYQEGDVGYSDNAERFIFFSKCIVARARRRSWRPDVIHVHDWQTGLVPAFLLHERRTGAWRNPPPACLTIHNLAYQGVFPAAAFVLTNLPPEYFTLEGMEFYGRLNCLKAGIAFAEAITTVSPRYAREITTEEFGCGLDGLLRRRQADLVGVLNGVDYEEWNTTNNPWLARAYSLRRLQGKTANKLALQRELGLSESANTPLFGSVSRLAEQKGVDIQLGALEEMLSADLQFVLLGSGSPVYEHGYRQLARRFPSKIAASFGYDQALSHRIEAGCDFFIMPSRFEPSGLNQMYSLRYGTIPIVRAVGGLEDSVTDAVEDPAHANGIKFREYSSRALAKAVRKALAIYARPDLLGHYRRNAMQADFSWAKSVAAYVRIYEAIAGRAGVDAG